MKANETEMENAALAKGEIRRVDSETVEADHGTPETAKEISEAKDEKDGTRIGGGDAAQKEDEGAQVFDYTPDEMEVVARDPDCGRCCMRRWQTG